MRAPLSIVIPTLNAGQSLPATLAALVEGLQAGLVRELIVSDGGSGDMTVEMAEGAGARVVFGPPGRGGQLRRGAEAAQGAWLLILHADTALASGWSDATLRALSGPEDRAYFGQLAFDAAGFAPGFVARWANLRARMLGLPFGDQGLLISRALYDRVGGYPDVPLMEDVAIARALRGHLRPLAVTATTSAVRYQRDGWVRRGLRNWVLLGRYQLGTPPQKLAEDYRHSSVESGPD